MAQARGAKKSRTPARAKAPAGGARPKGKTEPQSRVGTGQGGATRFKKGQSGNPGGRPKLPEELKAAARALSVDALNVLAKIMRSTRAPAAARVRAAEAILNRGYGTPPQSVEVTNLSDLPRIIIEAAE